MNDHNHDEEEYDVEVTCPVCGTVFECGSRAANAEKPPCCSAECEHDWPRVREDEIRLRESELTYRSGYDYACGYHE